ncbi:MAG TPA: ATP-binding cassette domain-containing protein [Flavisolibacter sp.]|nr:ATP-binding cassette domain-containing protein [Flavisolibacter sp.]
MLLQLQQVLPTYFEQSRTLTSEVWGKDLTFQKGELVKIVAPSGSGKTSLIHFLYGMRHEYQGTISYNGNATRNFSVEQFSQYRKSHISIVFQDLRLFPDQTVWENINIKRQLNPYHPEARIYDMAEQLGISSKLNAQCKICSYGEQQRIAIIRALMQPFDFLLLDEPFSHLDNNNARKAMDLMLAEAKSREASIVFADLERIEFFPHTRLYHL